MASLGAAWQGPATSSATDIPRLEDSFSLQGFIERNQLHEKLFQTREKTIYDLRRGNMRRPDQSLTAVYASLGLPPPQLSGQTILKTERSLKAETTKKLENGFLNGLFTIEQAFTLVQHIRQQKGKKMISDEDISAYLRSKDVNVNDQLVLQFKWREVIRFMQANPHVLM